MPLLNAQPPLPDNLETAQAVIADLSEKLRNAQIQIDHLTKLLFGKKAEKFDPNQLNLGFEIPPVEVKTGEEPDKEENEEADSGETKSAVPAKKKPRQRVERNLPIERIEIELPEPQRECPHCKKQMQPFGEEITSELEYQPARLFQKDYVRTKYACGHCHEGVAVAKAPERPLEDARCGPGLLAHVVVSKFQDHLPLYRQERILERVGLNISRSTLGDWVQKSALALSPLIAPMKQRLLVGNLIQTDDTGLRVLHEIEGSKTGHLWAYGHPEGEVIFEFDMSRGRTGPEAFLAGFKGFLQADAYAAYDRIVATEGVYEVGCWAHARRKIYDVKDTDQVRSHTLLVLIRKLYEIEREAKEKNLPPGARLALRKEKSKPLLLEIKKKLDQYVTELLPKSALRQAIGYLLNQWAALNRYLENGSIPIDNNACERALRGVAVGRKNWLFAGSESGASAAAILYTLIESCRRLGINAFFYLRDVLGRLPTHPQSRVDELTPLGWKNAFPDLAAKASIATEL